jgi:hypothetical protein
MHAEKEGLENMGDEIEKRIKSIAGQRGLDYDLERTIHLPPGDFVSFVLRATFLSLDR